MIDIVLTAMWLMLPAYIPNSTAAVFAGGKPIDGGRNLGDGKTTRASGRNRMRNAFWPASDILPDNQRFLIRG